MSGSGAGAEWRKYWILPLTAALGYSSSVLHIYSLGPFFEPLQQEFGWSRAEISSGVTFAAFISAIFCIPIGVLVDRIGPRVIGTVGVLLMCGSVALLSTATGSLMNWALLWCVVSLGTFGVLTTIWVGAVSSRFVVSRGMAIGVTLAGASIAATVFPLLASWLIGNYGWRVAFMGLGGIWAAVVFPPILFFFRGAQDEVKTDPQAIPPVLEGISVGEGVRSLTLYKLLLAGAFFGFTTVGAIVHFVPILRDVGAEPLAAAGMASLIGVFSIIGRLGTGFLLDRFPARIVGACTMLIPLIACGALLIDGANPFSQMVAAVTFGLTVGSEVDIVAYLASRHFGLKNFGALYGAIIMAIAFGTSFGPLAAGAVYDQYHTYAPFLILTMVLMAAGSLAVASLPRPVFAARGH